jgi:hypothetical protein
MMPDMALAAPFLAVFLLGACAASFTVPAPVSAGDGQYVEGQVLVRFRADVSRQDQERILREEGAWVEKALGGTGVLLVALPAGKSVPDAVRGFSRRSEVEYAEPNFRMEPMPK